MQDTKDAKYNKALAKVANRKITALPATESDKPYEFIDIPNEQCKWTNCRESECSLWNTQNCWNPYADATHPD
jgi:hypothetical protein